MRKIHPLWFAIAVIGATSNLASSAGNTVTKVTTFEDENGENPAACSLREAVRANNDMTDFGGCGFGGNREKNSIQLQDGVYKISESLGAIQVNRNLSIFGFDNGDYDHSDPLTGTRPLPKLPSTIIDGQSRTRIFDSTMKDASLTLSNLVIRNGGNAGVDRGGAILAGGVVSLFRVMMENNVAGEQGGAVFLSGQNSTLNTTITSFDHNLAPKGSAFSMSCIENFKHTERGVEILQSSFIENGSPTSLSVIEACTSTNLSFNTTTFSGNLAAPIADEGAVIRYMKDVTSSSGIIMNYVTAMENGNTPFIGYGAIGKLSLTASVIAFNGGKGCHAYTSHATSLDGNYNTLQDCPFVFNSLSSNTDLTGVSGVSLASEFEPLGYYGALTRNYLPKTTSTYILNKGPVSDNCLGNVDQRGSIRDTLVCDRGATERRVLTAVEDADAKNLEETDRAIIVSVMSNDIPGETPSERLRFDENYTIDVTEGGCTVGERNPTTKLLPLLYKPTTNSLFEGSCSYRLRNTVTGETSKASKLRFQIINMPPKAGNDSVVLPNGASAVQIDVLQNDSDANDGKWGALYCGVPSTTPGGASPYDCSKEPGVNIRIIDAPKLGYLTAEKKQPCPNNTADSSQSCFGGKLTYHPYNTLSPFSDSFTYSVYDENLVSSNTASVQIINGAPKEGTGGGSTGWLSLGVLGILALRRYRSRQEKA